MRIIDFVEMTTCISQCLICFSIYGKIQPACKKAAENGEKTIFGQKGMTLLYPGSQKFL